MRASDEVSIPEGVANLLTEREIDVIRLLVGPVCATTREAAEILRISKRTVEVHRAAIMKKTGAKNVAALARMVLAA
jgi:DNA-binding CsgD family transcriptional regulator